MIIKVDPAKLGKISWKAYAVRFGFGGAVTVLAGLVGAAYGPGVGGLFLAFPSISAASLTLIQKQDGRGAVGADAFGAAMGSLGLLGFAAIVWVAAPRWPGWVTLVVAMIGWLTLCFGVWLASRRVRHRMRRTEKRTGTV
jgi:hypothetical protein